MTASLKKFYNLLAKHPCLRCGSYGVEVAHIRIMPSVKSTGFLPRRQGIAAFGAIPLCEACHRTAADSIHAVGEQAFIEALGKPQGWVHGYVARSIAETLA